ncbi:histamine H2 receptor [Nematostella vectensis]|nr:histamine H2 receptor [Nematostella vectensis]XP_032220493.1 histamine H2 receptor [Nematostella vectensis]XP_048582846.1 histamine H2 receptor [Nematostella vectensis]
MATNNSTSAQQMPDFSAYFYCEYLSAIFYCVLSPFTVGANGLLLAAIYKDPLKCFRTPVTYFIVGLALVDLLTGLVVEPFFAVYYFSRYFYGFLNVSPTINLLATIAGFMSTVGLSTSFLIVLALSFSQFIAITFPHKYRVLITTRRVLICMINVVLYFIAFSLLQVFNTNIPKDLFWRMDLYLHATIIPILLVISHAFIFRSFKRFSKKSEKMGAQAKRVDNTLVVHSSNNNSNTELIKPSKKTAQISKSKANQKQLTIVTLLLSAVLLFCSLPHTIGFYLFLHIEWKAPSEEIAINIAIRVTDAILFLKVLLDPFIYCWRLPKYRAALRNTLMCREKSEINHSVEQRSKLKTETSS